MNKKWKEPFVRLQGKDTMQQQEPSIPDSLQSLLRAVYKLNQTLLKLQITVTEMTSLNKCRLSAACASFSLIFCLMREDFRVSAVCSKRLFKTFKCLIMTSDNLV